MKQEQPKLFDIEPTPKTMPPLLIGRKRRKLKRADLKTENNLIDQMDVEVKKMPYLVCKQPKTYKMIPYNWTQEQRKAYKASHYDEKGRFNFEPAPDFTIFGGQQNRR